MSDLPLIEMTEKARKHLERMLEKNQANAFRLSAKKTGCSGYMYLPEVVSAPKAGDVPHKTREGLQVYVDPKYVDIIRGTVIDYVEKEFGLQQLVFNNPNASGLCGCGESFQIKENGDGESEN